MIGNKNFKVFGPRAPNISYLTAPPYQRGQGIGNFFSSIFKKIVPYATKAIKSAASSKVAKTVAKQLTKHGAEALGDVVADAIEGSDPSIKAKAHLAQARTDVSNAIRQNNAVKRKRPDISTEQRPVKKKKKKTGFKGKTEKEFNIFHNH